MAPDAQTLMRSRYTAFVLDKLDYLLDTWHSSTRPVSLEPNGTGIKWLGLDVRRHAQQDDDHATVEFVARSRQNGRAARLHEVSRFVREDGRWFYVDGDFVEKERPAGEVLAVVQRVPWEFRHGLYRSVRSVHITALYRDLTLSFFSAEISCEG